MKKKLPDSCFKVKMTMKMSGLYLRNIHKKSKTDMNFPILDYISQRVKT